MWVRRCEWGTVDEPFLIVGNAQGDQEDPEQKEQLLQFSAVHHNIYMDA